MSKASRIRTPPNIRLSINTYHHLPSLAFLPNLRPNPARAQNKFFPSSRLTGHQERVRQIVRRKEVASYFSFAANRRIYCVEHARAPSSPPDSIGPSAPREDWEKVQIKLTSTCHAAKEYASHVQTEETIFTHTTRPRSVHCVSCCGETSQTLPH